MIRALPLDRAICTSLAAVLHSVQCGTDRAACSHRSHFIENENRAIRCARRLDLTVNKFHMASAPLGGHENRKSDGATGWITLWRGWNQSKPEGKDVMNGNGVAPAARRDGYLAKRRSAASIATVQTVPTGFAAE